MQVSIDWKIAANPIRKVAIERDISPKGIIEEPCSILASDISHLPWNRIHAEIVLLMTTVASTCRPLK
jgi:hypothetical protein